MKILLVKSDLIWRHFGCTCNYLQVKTIFYKWQLKINKNINKLFSFKIKYLSKKFNIEDQNNKEVFVMWLAMNI